MRYRRCWPVAVALIAALASVSASPPVARADAPTAQLVPARGRLLRQLSKETCAVDPRTPGLPRGLRDGDQLRLILADGEGAGRLALFTVTLWREGPGRVWLSSGGGHRLGLKPVAGRVRLAPALVTDVEDERDARARGELVERLLPRGQPPRGPGLLVLAPHGGAVETGTDDIARLMLDDPRLRGRAVAWLCLGFPDPATRRGAYDRWHITSTAISPRSFPRLAQLTGVAKGRPARFAHCLALHGHRGAEVLVGGAAPPADREAIAAALVEALPGTKVVVVAPGGRLGGRSKDNVVNRWSARGVQLELPRALRGDAGKRGAIARALTARYAAWLTSRR